MKQAITSAATSRRQISSVVRLGDKLEVWQPGLCVIDYGGGKWDDTTNALKERGVDSRVYDPFNRTQTHNDEVLTWASENADAAILSNVLNVIQEHRVRFHVLSEIASLVDVLYTTVYEGDRSGKGRVTRDGWQENRKLSDYIGEVKEYFSVVDVRNGLMIGVNL